MTSPLEERGVEVFGVFTNGKTLVDSFDESLARMPEFNANVSHYSAGGFAALGNASSFHDRFPRQVREKIYATMRPILQSRYKDTDYKMELIPDRMLLRKSGVTPTAEVWHRDLSPNKLTNGVLAAAGDIIYGGWVNCNEETQYFDCVPGTQRDDTLTDAGTGFTKEALKAYGENYETIAIPAGSLLLFRQELIHCVRSKKLPFDCKRVFIGIRLTKSSVPLIVNIQDIFQRGAVIPLKSGQVPRMYPKLWLVNWPDKLIDFSATCPAFMKETRMLQGKRLVKVGREEKPYDVVTAVAPSLETISPHSFAPYTEDELQIHLPTPL